MSNSSSQLVDYFIKYTARGKMRAASPATS